MIKRHIELIIKNIKKTYDAGNIMSDTRALDIYTILTNGYHRARHFKLEY